MKPEHELVAQSVRRFAEEVVRPALAGLNHYPDTELPERILAGLAELGLLELGSDDAALVVALGALSEVGAAPAAIVLANALGRSLVQRTRPELLASNGSPSSVLGYPLYLEPGEACSRLSLRRTGDELLLSGRAELVVNAPVASKLVLPVREREALVLVCVSTGCSGVSVGAPLLTLGMRGAPTADVDFTSVRLEPRQVLASPADALIREVSAGARAAAAAISSSIVRQSLGTALEYAKERYQGGKNIIEHQEVRRLLAQMLEDHALCLGAREQLARGDLPESRALALFSRAKQRASHATSDGVQLLGGYGYMEDYAQERCMRDAKQAECIFGRVEHARQEVAALLAEEGPR